MARYNNYRKKSYRAKTTHGKKFRTKSGRYGHYVYKNGRRVGFKSARSRSRTSYRRRY